ncbi:MAG: ATP-grasp domain-containing protein [Chromatiales bacterium]|nr:ATP-grasp domain-containing protein [Chromatiales bacterium]
MKRILLLVPSYSYRTGAFIEAARDLGVILTVGTDYRPVLSAEAESTVQIGLASVEEDLAVIRARAASQPFDGVIGTDDATVLLAAHVGTALGLPQNLPAAVEIATNKLLMRRALRDKQLPTPQFRYLNAAADLEAVAAQIEYPCVLKPLSLAGSRGVIRVDSPRQLVRAGERIRALLATIDGLDDDGLLAEGYIPGAELALEGVLKEGRLHPLALFDKPIPLTGPYFEETIYVTPSRFPIEIQQKVINAVQAAVMAIGLTDGAVHAEVRVNEGGVWVLEVAPRSIGGLCAGSLDLGGQALESILMASALGEDVCPSAQKGASGVMMMPISDPGELRSVCGVAAAQKVPGIVDVIVTIAPGEHVVPLPEGGRYLGFIFAKAPTPTAVQDALIGAFALLDISIVRYAREL